MKQLFTIFLFLVHVVAWSQQPNLKIIKEELLFQEGQFFKQCHASTIEETTDGRLLASWFGGSHEGNEDVVIWGASFNGKEWSTPVIWADGLIEKTRYPCWNPVLFRAKDEQTVYLYYKVGPNPREWWGMMKSSEDGGKTWSIPKKLPDGVFGPIKNRPLQLENGDIVSPSSVEISEDRWVAHIEKSIDNQKSWTVFPIDHQSAYNVIQPSILLYDEGQLQVLCRSKEGAVMSSWSYDQGETWTPLVKTNLINPNSATDAIRSDKHFFIVYNPDIPGKDWWEGRTKLRLAYSTDGIQWTDILQLEDQENGEFSYPTIFEDNKGFLHITYTYDRKNIKHILIQKNR
ncbi:exo-alpha-sialidase [Sphingobacterium sp. DN00404]|uniref:Exo-alpha-sialidase n=1 Tax=Sphingobacterium micropteri TaxID=2763501 RepID=A0ABR7YRM8_9SPHI|nr:sialidase family protein [Sphingobacterium micropteri]MBD1433989.1 exo-alpha-sialidase [Sphingobacterium micropteri]